MKFLQLYEKYYFDKGCISISLLSMEIPCRDVEKLFSHDIICIFMRSIKCSDMLKNPEYQLNHILGKCERKSFRT